MEKGDYHVMYLASQLGRAVGKGADKKSKAKHTSQISVKVVDLS